MQDEPGTYELAVEVRQGEQAKQLSVNILVAKENFSVEHLTLPKEKVDLDEKATARWKAEQEQVKQALAENSRLKLWRSNFLEPVNGKRTGIFGSVRVMNGKPRNPHNGEDIGAPMGTDVAATNDGVVRLTVDHIFSGRGIFVDHGLGFYSMYFHLSEILVKDGDLVKEGVVLYRIERGLFEAAVKQAEGALERFQRTLNRLGDSQFRIGFPDDGRSGAARTI